MKANNKTETRNSLLRDLGNVAVALILSPYARRIVWYSLKRHHGLRFIVGTPIAAAVFIFGVIVPLSMLLNGEPTVVDKPTTTVVAKPVENIAPQPAPALSQPHVEVKQPGGLPWDAPLDAIQKDLSGSTAPTIALVAIVGLLGYLIFGGELPVLFRSLVYIVLSVSILIAANTIFVFLGVAGN